MLVPDITAIFTLKNNHSNSASATVVIRARMSFRCAKRSELIAVASTDPPTTAAATTNSRTVTKAPPARRDRDVWDKFRYVGR